MFDNNNVIVIVRQTPIPNYVVLSVSFLWPSYSRLCTTSLCGRGLKPSNMEEEDVDEHIDRTNVESDIRVASGILRSGPCRRRLHVSREEPNQNLYFYCYVAHLLNLESWDDIATTGTLVFDPASGTVNADMVVVSSCSQKQGHTTKWNDTNSAWEYKDLEANEDFGEDDIRNLRYALNPSVVQCPHLRWSVCVPKNL
ncbi:hypothetical protein M413DRAFT_326748 [Hebeloma cylindrosporum]|uniref:Uncharacterized protein n=1 Tax=Hebeloma cylindrosporum TaxID=76867 RepID=A0A0C3BUD7_HEBCY|nr:hypothetical protein M413DRAFT_326748 [Hebeloma cylindrosporum h7]